MDLFGQAIKKIDTEALQIPIALFFALRPGARVSTVLQRCQQSLCKRFNITGPRVSPERFHVSVSIPGRPRRVVEVAESALKKALGNV
jgi:2'-5' RNA ligase